MESTPSYYADPMLWCTDQQLLPPYPFVMTSSFEMNALAQVAYEPSRTCIALKVEEIMPLKQEPDTQIRIETPLPAKRPRKKKMKFNRPIMPEEERKRLEAERRARTNVGNILLTYLYIKKRSGYDVERLFPDITRDEKENYYRFMVQMKRNCSGYLNEYRLSLLWNPGPELDGLNYEIVRVLSHYFLREILPIAIVTSARLPR